MNTYIVRLTIIAKETFEFTVDKNSATMARDYVKVHLDDLLTEQGTMIDREHLDEQIISCVALDLPDPEADAVHNAIEELRQCLYEYVPSDEIDERVEELARIETHLHRMTTLNRLGLSR